MPRNDSTALRSDSSENLASSQSPQKATSNASRRRRAPPRAVTRTVFIASGGSSPRKPTSRSRNEKSKVEKSRETPPPLVTREEIHSALTRGTRSSASYIFDVTASFFSLIKRFLAFFLFIYVLALIINALSASIRAVISPICYIPIISSSQLCRWQFYDVGSGKEPQQYVDYCTLYLECG